MSVKSLNVSEQEDEIASYMSRDVAGDVFILAIIVENVLALLAAKSAILQRITRCCMIAMRDNSPAT